MLVSILSKVMQLRDNFQISTFNNIKKSIGRTVCSGSYYVFLSAFFIQSLLKKKKQQTKTPVFLPPVLLLYFLTYYHTKNTSDTTSAGHFSSSGILCGTSWGSYNSTHFCLQGDWVRFHRLRAHSHKAVPHLRF